jgi:uncharacterized protein (UPF0216 family)
LPLRRITPLPLPDVAPRDLGPRPAVEWCAPTDLYVDDTYQRDVTKRTIRVVRKAIDEFSWARMKPPIVVRVDGLFHVINGQHTAIAAATLNVPLIPVIVVQAETMSERAGAFVSHNTDQVKVSSIDVFHAMVASGNEEACEIQGAMHRAKVRLRTFNQTSAVAEGDTMAIGTIRQVYQRRGVKTTRLVLQVLVDAKRCPISAPEIKAVEHIICELKRGIDLTELARIIRVDGDAGLRSAHSHSKVGRIPVWKALIERWKGKIANVGRAA